MASYHLSAKILSRSSGRSGVAAAAYRSRSQIHDVRQGMTFDYSKKQDIGHTEILAPDHAPIWMRDRSELWNGVEAAEKRKDAQIMREIEVALPVELNHKEQVELLRAFCQNNFVSKGMIADICVHQQNGNPHAHIMLTMREIKGEGFGKKVRDWNKKANLMLWREEWANTQNVYLAKAGFDKRVDHRSYAEQGIDIEPQVKKGVPGYADPKVEYERTQEYKRIAFENGQRIIEDPNTALDHLSRNQSTFTYDDIIKYVHSHCDDSQFYQAVAAITSSPELYKIEAHPYDRFSRYTTLSLLKTEQSMLRIAKALGASNDHRIDEKYIRQTKKNISLSAEQSATLDQIAKGNNLHAVIGHAGTGKSYTLRAVRETFEAAGYNIQGAALAGVAAEGLEVSSGIRSTTIHRKLFDWDNGRDLLNRNSVLVIDEAGMVGTRQMQRLLSEAKESGAMVLLVGDNKQTQAVEAGGAFRGIIEQVETSRLNEVWRQDIEWQKEATRLLSGDTADIHKALDMYHDHGHISGFDTYGQAASAMLTDYVKAYRPDATSVMTAHKNDDIDRLNLVCRDGLRRHTDYLGSDQVKLKTSSGHKYFAVGDRVLFLRNERSLGVKNGTFGTVEAIDHNGKLTVAISKNRSVVVDTEFYNNITYGYAATIHKLQGATIDRAFFLASEGVDRHIGYVAMSRHRNDVRLYYSEDRFQNYEHLKRCLGNLGEKELLNDYGIGDDQITEALNRLTDHNATFTAKEFNSVIRHLDEADRNQIYDRIESLGEGIKGELRYTTSEMAGKESALFKSANALGQSYHHSLDKQYLTEVLSEHHTDRYQRFVFDRVASGSDLALVDYQYGADRAYAAGIIAKAYQGKGYVVEGLSLSNMGAYHFKKDSGGVEASTIHKKLWEWDKGRNLLNDKSVLIIDNAGMIGTRQTQRVLDHAEKADAKVIMLGDDQHLQSISAGGAFRGIYETANVTRATLLRKDQSLTWQQEALDLLKGDRIDAARAIDLYAENGCIRGFENETESIGGLVGDWLSGVRSSRTYRQKTMLAYTNDGVEKLNETARIQLKRIGYIEPKDTEMVTAERGKICIGRGERIMFLRKDEDMGVQSGSLGTIRHIDGEKISVRLDSGSMITIDKRIYNDLAHGYAATVYRSAGLKSDDVYILAGKQFNKHASLSALQCGSASARIYHSFKSHQQLKWYMSRSADKDLASDYPLQPNVYRISVKVDSLGKIFERVISIEPQISNKAVRKKLDRAARDFAYDVTMKNKIKSPEKDLTVKIEKVDDEKAREYIMQKETQRSNDRKHQREYGD